MNVMHDMFKPDVKKSLNKIFIKFSIQKILAHLHIAVVKYNPIYILLYLKHNLNSIKQEVWH